jgi:hypothetical protein
VGVPAGVHAQVSRVLAAPFPEVLYAFEPLTGWGNSSTASSWSGLSDARRRVRYRAR